MAGNADFFISYNHRDVLWAEWIAWHLEAQGYKTRIQAWDFLPGSNFVLEMQKATTDANRTIAVLSPNYLAAEFTQPEWAAAFVLDPKGENRKLIFVRVTPCECPGLLASVIQIRLDNLTEEIAKKKLLEGVRDGRAKPSLSPAFPGSERTPTQPRYPSDRPTIWNVPYPPNPYFTGREDILNAVHKTLSAGAVAAVIQPTAVHGLGGIGKTQLVSEYSWIHRADYDAVLWVHSDSPAAISRNFAALSGREALSLPESEGDKQDTQVSAVKVWLRTHQRWLLVFDSADAWECIEKIRELNVTGLHGHVIVTSRIAEWPVTFTSLVVDTLPESEAAEFLLRRATVENFTPGTKEQAIETARKLGCLPLALEQAAAYMLRHRISLNSYEQLLKRTSQRLLEFQSEGGTLYQKTVASTWLVTKEMLSDVSRVLLRFTAFFAPDQIPRNLVAGGADVISTAVEFQRTGNISENPAMLSDIEISEALADLAEYSLIRLAADNYDCHRLLQSVELNSVSEDLRDIWLDMAMNLIAKSLPDDPDEPENRSMARTLIPHVRALLAQAKTVKSLASAGQLWLWCGKYSRGEGDFAIAEFAIIKSLTSQQASENQNWKNIISIKNELGQVLFLAGRLDEAEVLLREAIQIAEQNYGQDFSKIRGVLGNLGACLTALGRNAEGEELLKRSLEYAEKEEGPLSPGLAIVVNNLAKTAVIAGRYAEAEGLMKRALALASNEGSRNEELVAVLSNYGLMLIRLHRLDEAEPFIRQACELAEQANGKTHWRYARALNNYALLLHEMQRYDEAEPMFTACVSLSERIYGPSHPEVSITSSNLARLYDETKRPALAQIAHERAIRIFETARSLDLPGLASAYANYAFCLISQGKFRDAEQSFRKALELDEKAYGRDHLEVATDMSNLGGLLMEQKRYAEADPLIRRSLKIIEEKLGKQNHITKGMRMMLEDLMQRKQMFRVTLRK